MKKVFAALLVIGLLIRFIGAVFVEGFSSDIGCFITWASLAAKDLPNFYNAGIFCDYPPVYIYVLYIVGKLAELFSVGLNSFIVKLPSIAADLVTSYFIYRLAEKHFKSSMALFLASFYVFNPVVILDSALWGQVDSFCTMLLVFGIYLLTEQKITYSSAVLAVAVLMKPQAIFVLPILLFALIRRKSLKEWGKAFAAAVAVAVIVILPFSRDPLWIFNLYLGTAEGYQYASMNAFNLFGMLGANLKMDAEKFLFLSYGAWGILLDVLLFAFAGWVYFKGKHKGTPMLTALLLTTGFFVVSVRMHERYMFPAVAFALMAFIYIKDKRLLYVFAGLTVTNFINILEVLRRMILTDYPHISPGEPVIILTSLANVLIFSYLVKITVDILVKGKIVPLTDSDPGGKKDFRKKGNPLYSQTRAELPELTALPSKLVRKDLLIMAGMTLIYLLISVPNLGSRAVPETSWTPSQTGESFTIDLGRPVTLSRLYYYGGLGDGTYRIEYQDASGQYQAAVDLIKKDIFVWKYIALADITTERLKITAAAPGGTLNEIALFERGGKSPVKDIEVRAGDSAVSTPEGLKNLIDEQDRVDVKHSYLSGMIFDEIYHARTAYEYLNGLEPFEWTHPPLGKIFISIGIAIFGMNPFGWRIIGTLFGAAMVPILYLFGRKLFNSRFYGFCAAFLMMFDFMHFSLTRIATIDVYGTFFVILMYYYMYDYYVNKSYNLGFKRSLKPLFLSGLFFGLGAASKWIGLYAGGGLALLFFMAKYREYKDYSKINNHKKAKKPEWLKDFIPLYIKKTMALCVLFFVIIPIIIYCLSYIPYLSVPGPGHGPDLIWRNQRDMLNYHSEGVLSAEHAFASSWWEWPIIKKPVWTYMGTDLPEGRASSMVLMGNPAIWWVGIPAVLAALYIAIKKKENKMTVVFAAMAFQFLPWIPIARLTFIYHYFSSVPFMMLSIVYVMKTLADSGKVTRKVIYGYLAGVFVLFVLFYPILSGMEVPRSYIDSYLLWFKGTWIF